MPELIEQDGEFGVLRFAAHEKMTVDGISYVIQITIAQKRYDIVRRGVVERAGQAYSFEHWTIFRLADFPEWRGTAPAVAPGAPVLPGRYPHRCGMCGKPCYIGFSEIEHEHGGRRCTA